MKLFDLNSRQSIDINIFDESNNGYEEKIIDITSEFFNGKHNSLLQNKSLEIIIPVDFKAAHYKRSRDSEKDYIDKYGMPSFNAILLLPTDPDASKFVILYSLNYINDKLELYKTLFHEFTHIVDYTQYFNLNGNIYIDDISSKIEHYYFEFYLWTEFNAKRVGLKKHKDEIDKFRGRIDLVRTASEFKIDILKHVNELRAYYELVHFLARLAVHNVRSKDSMEFPSMYLNSIFNNNIPRLYNTLKNIKSYKQFNSNKGILRKRLNLKNQENYFG